jgi:hypothetical protein
MMQWKLTIKHGYEEVVFLFDALPVAETFLKTFLKHKVPDEPAEEGWRKKEWSYVIEPIIEEDKQDGEN